MRIKSVKLEGFRNFKEDEINFTEKSLVIGSNDIGKTNLIYALRILLDRTLSDADIEPKETDFFVHEPTNEYWIRIVFEDIHEECVIAKLREHVSDDGQLILGYHATRNPDTNSLDYKIFAGKDDESLIEINGRYYLRTLNLKYIGSRRDLLAYIHHERRRLLQDARELRTDDEVQNDNALLVEIERGLDEVGAQVSGLSYITKSTDELNTQLGELSFHNQNHKVVFDVGASAPAQFVDRLQLASQIDGQSVVIGGDGRNNQIQLALWSSRNKIQQDADNEPLEVSFFCIEEPEAHLHPHQQRKLSQFLNETLEGQVIITTHSPQIACEVPPSSIIRLYPHGNSTKSAGNGVNPFTEAALIDFGYRLDVISAETFFADVVLLVEGVSEQLFFKALASQIGIDLDRLNISVLMVDGVGFKPYASMLSSLEIPFIIRTDNDIFKIPGQDKFRLAGVQRAISLYKEYLEKDDVLEELLAKEKIISGFDTSVPPKEIIEFSSEIAQRLEESGVYIASTDLEHDLHSEIPDVTSGHFELPDGEDVVTRMQKRKAIFMFEFLQENANELAQLADSMLAKPLHFSRSLAEEVHGTPTDS